MPFVNGWMRWVLWPALAWPACAPSATPSQRQSVGSEVPATPAADATPSHGSPEPECLRWDADGDRIPDYLDRCPLDRESYNGYEDADGCPDRGMLTPPLASDAPASFGPVFFEPGGTRLAAFRDDEIARIARRLRARADVGLVELQGHVGHAHPGADPLALSAARAELVRQGLVAAGVDATRLRTAGYADRCPVSSARPQLDERVTIVVVEQQGRPLGVTLVCDAARDLIPKDRWRCRP